MPILIFCFDGYCGWSFAFKESMLALHEKYKNDVQIEVLSGGLLQPNEATDIEIFAPHLLQITQAVTQKTGIQFGSDYLWHLQNPKQSDWFPNSLMPATALCIFKEALPNQQIPFAVDILIALQEDARDLTDPEAYRHLLDKYQLDVADFFAKLKSKEYEEKAKAEFDLCLQLKANSFPSIYIQNEEGKLFFVQAGWGSLEDVTEKIDALVKH